MEKENNKKSISENVFSEIKKNRIEMRPKLYFVIKSILFIGFLILLLVFLLYLGSLTIFVLRANNIFDFQGMGYYAFRSIILSFPWYLVFSSVVLIILVEIFSNKFRFVYRNPLIYSLFVIIVLVLAGSFFVEKSSVHQYFFNLSQREKLPIMGRMYKNLGNLDIENAYIGKILEKKDDYWTMELSNGEVVSLRVNEETKGRRVYLEIKEGSDVMVIGELKSGIIDVFTFRKINDCCKFNER